MTLISDRVDISNYITQEILQNWMNSHKYNFFLFFDINTVHEPPNATVII